MPTPPRLHTLASAGWFRVYDAAYPPLSFNPRPAGNARFSPFEQSPGATVAFLYGGDSVNAALMETVFHEAPIPSAKAVLTERGIEARRWAITRIEATQPLVLVDLTSPGLRRNGLSPSDLIDTNAGSYPVTQQFARDLYLQFPAAQGIRWVSRLYNGGVCTVLWDDRIAPSTLVQRSVPVSVLTDDVRDPGLGGPARYAVFRVVAVPATAFPMLLIFHHSQRSVRPEQAEGGIEGSRPKVISTCDAIFQT